MLKQPRWQDAAASVLMMYLNDTELTGVLCFVLFFFPRGDNSKSSSITDQQYSVLIVS